MSNESLFVNLSVYSFDTMFWHNAIPVPEPLRGKRLMEAMNDWVTKHDVLVRLVPFTADVFVFTYPVYLCALYLRGIGKKKEYYKEAALYVFFSVITATVVNLTIQYFTDKSRPETYIDNKEQLILSHLPTDPFPSDHAAVAAAVAMSTMLRGMKHNDKLFLRLSVFFRIACGLMSISRVAVAIHRPTDILVGIAVGVVSCIVLLSWSVRSRIRRTVIRYIIMLEKRIFKKVFHVEQ